MWKRIYNSFSTYSSKTSTDGRIHSFNKYLPGIVEATTILDKTDMSPALKMLSLMAILYGLLGPYHLVTANPRQDLGEMQRSS